ncbi:DUF3021 domain-containing protein [Ruminococcaceae bacterium OttesenSCG-928-D13]|nr:DUF3021 domain-containing protein [Ruminococcaceae bacterium OttesenSCG-928-D13]
MNGERLKNSGFARMYLWTTKAKYTMGIFFIVHVLGYLLLGLLGLLGDGAAVTLDFFTAVQMMFACYLIGVLQQWILPAEKLSRARCVLWGVSGVAATLVFNLVFGWFRSFPTWYLILFLLFVALGMVAIILGYYLQLHRETKHLNRRLEQYQKRNPGKQG